MKSNDWREERENSIARLSGKKKNVPKGEIKKMGRCGGGGEVARRAEQDKTMGPPPSDAERKNKIQEQLQARKKKRKEKKQSSSTSFTTLHPSIHPLHRSLMLHIKGEDLIPHPSPKKKGEKKKKSCVMDPLPTQNKKERNSEEKLLVVKQKSKRGS